MADDLDALISRGYIDSRDIIERLRELDARENDEDDPLDEDEQAELAELRVIDDEGLSNTSDWQYGETLIAESDFVEYAEQLADDIGAVDKDASWPVSYIDWNAAADALRMDYTEVEIRGTTYLARG